MATSEFEYTYFRLSFTVSIFLMTMHIQFVCSILILCLKLTCCRLGHSYKVKDVPLKEGEYPGEPLILTPYLDQNKIEEARNLSLVPKEQFLGIESYSGYFTVDDQHDSNSFFWFFPATNANYREVPVVLWLQGGPGWASIYGTFTENGPFEAINGTTLKLRDMSWTSDHSVIYIDNPVGTGYSFTNGRYCTSEEEIGEDLYKALIQFFQLFPELQKNDFFITGESYAGKYIPALSYTIHQKNPEADLKINLKGLAIGNGLSDTINQLNYGDFLFQVGLIDYNVRAEMTDVEERVIQLIQEEKYEEAFYLYDTLVIGDYTEPTILKKATDFENFYNILEPKKTDNSQYSVFVQQCHIREALHVGNVSFETDTEVAPSLNVDFMKSVAPWISELLSHYRVLIYNGQLDIIIAYPLTVNYLRNLDFDAAEEYAKAQRYEWIVDDEIAGYVKEAGNLTEVLVRNAGHVVPADQPKWALNLISKFIRNEPLH